VNNNERKKKGATPCVQGRRHGFKGGRDNFARSAGEKFFFEPLTLRLPGGYKNDYGMITVGYFSDSCASC